MSAGDEVTRRVVLGSGAGLVSLAALALAGCSADAHRAPSSSTRVVTEETAASTSTSVPQSATARSTTAEAEGGIATTPRSASRTARAGPASTSAPTERRVPDDSSSARRSSAPPASRSTATPSPSPSTSHTTSAPRPSPSPTKPRNALVKVSAIPLRGSTSETAGGNPIVLARPSPNHVVGFSAICTHMGCTVGTGGRRLVCPCHGSVYNAFTGAVLQGPAPDPLPPFAVHIENGYVVPD